MSQDETDRLKSFIAYYLSNKSETELGSIIKMLSGHSVIPFDKNDSKDLAVLEKLKQAAEIAVKDIKRDKIRCRRVNEVGNRIEEFVRTALIRVGYQAHVPVTSGGNLKATGYPDLEFRDEFGRITYLECKTYNIRNINTTQRSFYLSPSNEFKITADAHHIIVSLEIVEAERIADMSVYSSQGWKILDAATLPLDLKLEFNSDNARLYGSRTQLLLAQSNH